MSEGEGTGLLSLNSGMLQIPPNADRNDIFVFNATISDGSAIGKH